MPFTFTFTDKQLSIIEQALENMIETNNTQPFSVYDVAEMQDMVTDRLQY